MSLATRRRLAAADMTAAQLAEAAAPAEQVENPRVSLARRHRARVLGKERALASVAGIADTAVKLNDTLSALAARNGPAATEYDLQKARLGVDLRRLSEIQSVERKIELKRELLPQYREWIDGVLAADSGAEDVILGYAMIWAIDIGDYAYALPLIDYMLDHDLPLPERFDRTAPTLIVEEIAEAALKLLGSAKLEAVDDDKLAPFATEPPVLAHVLGIADGHDMPDQVKGKAYKAVGLVCERAALLRAADADGPAGGKHAMFEIALQNYRRALALDANIGVKKRIEKIERALKDLPAPENA